MRRLSFTKKFGCLLRKVTRSAAFLLQKRLGIYLRKVSHRAAFLFGISVSDSGIIHN